jgi:hypothetical protein
MQKLNSGKAADEYGITAEHVKFAGSKIYSHIWGEPFCKSKLHV